MGGSSHRDFLYRLYQLGQNSASRFDVELRTLDRPQQPSGVKARALPWARSKHSIRMLPSPTILVVDDEVAGRNVLRKILVGAEYRVVEASSGAEVSWSG